MCGDTLGLVRDSKLCFDWQNSFNHDNSFSFRSVALIGYCKTRYLSYLKLFLRTFGITHSSDSSLGHSLLTTLMAEQAPSAGPFPEYLPGGSRMDRNTDLFNKTDANYHSVSLPTTEIEIQKSFVLSPTL